MEWVKWLVVGILIVMLISVLVLFIKVKRWSRKTKWIHRADMDYKDKNGVVHFHGMCESCGFIHDFIDGHTGQYKFCPECGSKNEQWANEEGDGE